MKTKILLLALTHLLPLRAAPLDAEERRMGFVALSDGKSFAGWRGYKKARCPTRGGGWRTG